MLAVVLAGGEPPEPALAARLGGLATPGVVIAADGGLAHAAPLGLRCDVLVGDLDSVAPDLLAEARATGTTVEAHPVAKDATDLELALLVARSAGARRVVVLGGGGGRIDHLLGNALVLAEPGLAPMAVEAWIGTARLLVARDRSHVDATELGGRPGETLSLFALAGVARGVHTHGLRYPLRGEDLHPGSTRGLSNVVVDPPASVWLASGVLLAVAPEAFAGGP